jgi:hypothetical protein
VPLIFCPYYTSAEVVTTVGVDTHKDVLTSPSPWWTVSAETPRHSEFVPTSPVGYKELVDSGRTGSVLRVRSSRACRRRGHRVLRLWARPLVLAGPKGIEVFEVIRPRRRDQYTAAANPTPSTPKRRPVAVLAEAPPLAGPKAPMARSRCSAPSGLRVAQRGEGACSGRQPVLKAMLITAPEGLKEGLKSELRALSPQPSWLRRFRGFGRGREPLRCGSGHQVRAALGGAPLPAKALGRNL